MKEPKTGLGEVSTRSKDKNLRVTKLIEAQGHTIKTPSESERTSSDVKANAVAGEDERNQIMTQND